MERLPKVIGVTRYHSLKRKTMQVYQMQAPTDIAIYETILAALVIQFAMILVNRKARDSYVADIVHFRRPKNPFSKYYEWRVTSLRNAIVDAVVNLALLISVILGVAYFSDLLSELIDVIVIVAFVVGLASLSSIQMVWRVKKVIEQEIVLMHNISSSDDMIGKTKIIVDDVYEANTKDSGHLWFALFRIAQFENSLGYSVRDVLLEKGKEVLEDINIQDETKIRETLQSSDEESDLQ